MQKIRRKKVTRLLQKKKLKKNKQNRRDVSSFDLIFQCVHGLILASRGHTVHSCHTWLNVREFVLRAHSTWLQAPTDHWVSVPEQGRRWQVLDRDRVDGGVRHAPSATVIVNVGVISCRQTISLFCTPSPQLTEHSPHSPTTHLK